MARHTSAFRFSVAFAIFAFSAPACGDIESDADEVGDDEDDDLDIHFRPAVPICPNCKYRTATFTLQSGSLQGGTISAARMNTSVTHSTCPYPGYQSPCTMDMSFDAKCKVPGGGSYQIKSPNGYSTGATGSGSVDVTVSLPGGGVTTFSVSTTSSSPTNATPPTPCGDTPLWQITD